MHSRRRNEGQALVLFAISVTVLIGFAALAIDLSRVHATKRFERSVADAAALAGAQDLQGSGTRAVTAGSLVAARTHALQSLVAQLAASGSGSCNPSADILNCPLPGTPYRVSIRTPAPSCTRAGTSTCDPSRSVQVAVANPTFETTFAHLFGQTTWNVGQTSVAGLVYAGQYAVIALRPPNGTDTGAALGNIAVNGNPTVLNVVGGDIGTNRSLTSSGTVTLEVAPGYAIYHYDPPTPWGPSPAGQQLAQLIPDPNYPIPSTTGGTSFPSLAAAKDSAANCESIVNTRILADPAYRPFVPLTGGTPNWSKVNCYMPGIYSHTLNDDNNDLTILEPGLYFFNAGVDLKSSLVGGYEASAPGVTLVFPRTQEFKNNNTGLVSLNAGTKLGNAGGSEAAAARDFSGNEIKTPTTPPFVMSIIVQKDANCTVTQPYPGSCDDNHNDTIRLNGGSSLYIAGVMYAPSDNISVAGGNTSAGYVGQVIGWTVTYSGGSTLNQSYPGNVGNGILRIDPACSAPAEPCVP